MSTEGNSNPRNRRRRRKRSGEQADGATGIAFPQLERQVLRNRFAPVEPLDEEQINLIHEASMTLLEELGIEVLGDTALDVLRKGGAEVDNDGMVRMDRDLVMQCLSTAPKEFNVTSHNP